MTQQLINNGAAPNDGTGDSPRDGMAKANANFTELYAAKDAQAAAIALKAPSANPTFTGTVSGITKAMVGLSNVDNTPDTSKPVSTAQQTAIDAGDIQRLTAKDFGDFIVTGLVTPGSGGLTGVVTSPGVAYVSGKRVELLVGNLNLTHTFGASRDVYIDLDYNGVMSYTELANGSAAPSVGANSTRLCKVVTNASAIASVTRIASMGAGLALRYDTKASFPATGDMDVLYIANDTGIVWVWNGTAYTESGGIHFDSSGNVIANVNHRTGTLAALLSLDGGDGEISVATDALALVRHNGVSGGAKAFYAGRRMEMMGLAAAVATVNTGATTWTPYTTLYSIQSAPSWWDETTAVFNIPSWAVFFTLDWGMSWGVDASGTLRRMRLESSIDGGTTWYQVLFSTTNTPNYNTAIGPLGWGRTTVDCIGNGFNVQPTKLRVTVNHDSANSILLNQSLKNWFATFYGAK